MGLHSNEYAEEAATAEFLMKESHSRLDIAKYTANQNTMLWFTDMLKQIYDDWKNGQYGGQHAKG